MATTYQASLADLLARPDGLQRFELIDGKMVDVVPVGFPHGYLESHIGWRLTGYVNENHLGVVVTGEVLFELDSQSHLARAADIAFVQRGRLHPGQMTGGVFHGAPDLVVEIISPSNTANEIQLKVDHWIIHGSVLVMLVYPELRTVILWQVGSATVLRGDDEVRLDPVLPGFQCKTSELFPDLLDQLGVPDQAPTEHGATEAA